MKAPLKHDPAAALAALGALLPGLKWHLFAIAPDAEHPPASICVAAGQLEQLSRWLDQHAGSGIYYALNPLHRMPQHGKARKTDVAAAVYLHVDVDPRPGEPLDAERIRILALLREPPEGVPPPTVIVFSGGGYQALWALQVPIPLGGDVDKAKEAERFNRWLEQKFGADACSNIDRVLRLPGTINWPNAKKRAAGREIVRAELVELHPERIYDLTRFQQADPVVDQRAEVGDAVHVPDLKVLRKFGVRPQVIAQIKGGTWSEDASEDRWSIMCELARCEVPPEMAAGILTQYAIGWRTSKSRQITTHEALYETKRAYGHVRAELEAKAAERALPDAEKPQPGVKRTKNPKPPAKVASDAVERPGPDADPGEPLGDAIPDLECDRQGRPYVTQENVRLALRHLGVQVRFNLFTSANEISGLDGHGPRLDDAALRRLWLRIDEELGFRIGKAFFLDVVEDLGQHNAYHPVRDYLASLTWDGVARIDRWLVEHGGAEDSAYVRAVSALVLIAAVRRVRQPGCKFDEILVLEGKQGVGKSAAIATLAGPRDWFTDSLSLSDTRKEVLELIEGKWFVELPELAGMRKSEVEHLKAFAARTVDRARMAYARTAVDRPRQGVFIGSTNEAQYLRDMTGNRRMWPVKITRHIDVKQLAIVRDQLWAEAAKREAAGASIRLARKLWPHAAKEQADRLTEDPWCNVLADFLGDGTGRLRKQELLSLVLRIPIERQTQDQLKRLDGAMSTLGWDATRLRFVTASGGDNRAPCYARGTEEQRNVQLRVLLDDGGRWTLTREDGPQPKF
jgi:hypothetical protein